MADIVSVPSDIVATDLNIGTGSVAISSSSILKYTLYLSLNGLSPSSISSADLKLYLPNELNLLFFDLNSTWILLSFSCSFILI